MSERISARKRYQVILHSTDDVIKACYIHYGTPATGSRRLSITPEANHVQHL